MVIGPSPILTELLRIPCERIPVQLAQGLKGGFLLFPAAAVGSYIGGYVYEMNPTYPWIILSASTLASLALAVRNIIEPENAQS